MSGLLFLEFGRRSELLLPNSNLSGTTDRVSGFVKSAYSMEAVADADGIVEVLVDLDA